MPKTQREYLLDDLFRSPIQVKLVRFFIRNPDKKLERKATARFLREGSGEIRLALKILQNIKFLNAKKNGRDAKFSVNKAYPLYSELRALILKASPTSLNAMKRAIGHLGRVKLAVASGIFLGEDSSRADLLVVGDRLSPSKLKNLIGRLEAEVGQEISFAALTTKEFQYRLLMYDKFVRDILEHRHEKLINKLRL